MALTTLPFPAPRAARVIEITARADEAAAQHLQLNAEDGTLELLRTGFLVAGVAALSLLATLSVCGGVGQDGPRSVSGWLLLMVALMSMPFGLLLLLLGGAKWLRNHWLSRSPLAGNTLSHR